MTTSVNKTIRFVVQRAHIHGVGGFGVLYACFVKALLISVFGRKLTALLPVRISAFDFDDHSRSVNARINQDMEPVGLSSEQLFIPTSMHAREVIAAAPRDAALAPLTEGLSVNSNLNLSKGTGGNRRLAALGLAHVFGEVESLHRREVELACDEQVITRLGEEGVVVNTEAPPNYFSALSGFGAAGSGTAHGCAVFSDHAYRRLGINDSRRTLFVGIHGTLRSEPEAAAPLLALLREVELSYRHPEQFEVFGFARQRLEARSPLWHKLFPLGPMAGRGAAPSRENLAMRAAMLTVHQVLGGAAGPLASFEQDVARRIEQLPSDGFGHAVYANANAMTIRYDRPDVVRSVADMLQSRIARHLRDNA